MSKSIDEIIRQAMERGDFDNLKNKGKKLNLDDYFATPEESRVGYSVLKNSGFLPDEVVLLKEIAELEEQILKAGEGEARALRKQIESKRLKYNLMMERFKNR